MSHNPGASCGPPLAAQPRGVGVAADARESATAPCQHDVHRGGGCQARKPTQALVGSVPKTLRRGQMQARLAIAENFAKFGIGGNSVGGCPWGWCQLKRATHKRCVCLFVFDVQHMSLSGGDRLSVELRRGTSRASRGKPASCRNPLARGAGSSAAKFALPPHIGSHEATRTSTHSLLQEEQSRSGSGGGERTAATTMEGVVHPRSDGGARLPSECALFPGGPFVAPESDTLVATTSGCKLRANRCLFFGECPNKTRRRKELRIDEGRRATFHVQRSTHMALSNSM